jgi:hypothetical protein
VSLTSCKAELRLQEARDIGNVFMVNAVSLGLNSLPSLFLTVSDMKFNDAELCQLQYQFHTFRTQ